MAVILARSGLCKLQMSGLLGTTTMGGVATIELLGLYPTAEPLSAESSLRVVPAGGLGIGFGILIASRTGWKTAQTGYARVSWGG